MILYKAHNIKTSTPAELMPDTHSSALDAQRTCICTAIVQAVHWMARRHAKGHSSAALRAHLRAPGGPYLTPLFFSSGCSIMTCRLGASLKEFMLMV